jgi:quercetin dioxygenase-like cupin family protein
MKATALIVAAGLICSVNVWAQANALSAVEISEEPHHSAVLQNEKVRVFRLKLQPKEVTTQHRHKTFYAYVSLRPVTIRNEVRGRQPVITRLDGGELHTSKGGFVVAERNESSEPAEVLVIEAPNANSGEFATAMGGFQYHDAAFGELFVAPAVRGYAMTIAAGGRTEQHVENYDRLILAISDLKLRENVAGQSPVEFEMKAGDIRWMPRLTTHATTNVGTSPATFITLEFK